jgi:transposase InsO family protein
MRPASGRTRQNRQLVEQIRTIHSASRHTYGSARVHAELVAQGVRCSQNRVARLMRVANIHPRRPRRTRVTTDSRHVWPIAENLLHREFAATAPNTKWTADI